MVTFLYILSGIIQSLLVLAAIYYLYISSFSLIRFRHSNNSSKENSFAIVVAAHNEKEVIGDLIESLKELDYPKDKYDIFIVADNCTDNTGEIAEEMGVNVIRRNDTEKRGKGYALDYAFNHIMSLEKKYDFFTVFDADNLVKPDFLRCMNNKLNEGYEAVQGYLDSKNPYDSMQTFSYSLWYWLNNRCSQLARNNLKYGARLGGTGFAVSVSLIKEYGWGATCLAEDAEFTLKLALNDIKVGWAHDAVIYDEKPLGVETSWHQRTRWVQGLNDVSKRYILPLFKKAIKEKKILPLHMIMNFWGDSLHSASLIYMLAVRILLFFFAGGIITYLWAPLAMRILLDAVLILSFLVFMAVLYEDKKLSVKILTNFIGFIVWMLSWIPIGINAVVKKNTNQWFHTPHKSNKK